MKNIILGFILGAGTVYLTLQGVLFTDSAPTHEQLQANYYAEASATLVSPHNIRERLTHGIDDFVLIDVRAEEDYVREHVTTALNIDTGKELDEVLAKFRQVIEENPGKEIVIYCYSSACMNGRKAGNFLAENGIFVKEMTIGWNEWRYGWEMWNYDTEWEEHAVEEYVTEGTEPGEIDRSIQRPADSCGVDGELSC